MADIRTQPFIITFPKKAIYNSTKTARTKKGNILLCQNYRTIRFICHPSGLYNENRLEQARDQTRYLLLNRLDSEDGHGTAQMGNTTTRLIISW